MLIPTLAAALALNAVPEAPLNEVWVNPGFYTYHFKRDIQLRDNNPGFGVEYRLSTTTSFVGGKFENSDWGDSRYIAALYQPWAVGPVRLGAVAGLFDGYPKLRDGKVFPSLLPVASVEYERVGLHMTVVPPFGARLRAGVSVQLRVKLL